MYKPLYGLCKDCLGCERQSYKDFEGVYRCESTSATMTAEEIKMEQKKIKEENT